MARYSLFIKSLLVLIFYQTANAAFEQIGTGARPLGMGNAFTVVADDVHSMYYNPAGLSKVSGYEVTSSYEKLYSGFTDNSNLYSGYFAGAASLKKYGSVGLSWNFLDLTNVYTENTFSLSYGRKFFNLVRLGATTKMLKRSLVIDDYLKQDPLVNRLNQTPTAYTFDIGMQYEYKKYAFGITGRNLTSPNLAFYSTDIVPASVSFGIGYLVNSLSIDAETSYINGVFTENVGVEREFMNIITLRAGYETKEKNEFSYSLGTGFKFKMFRLDYAYYSASQIKSVLGRQVFSLSMRFK